MKTINPKTVEINVKMNAKPVKALEKMAASVCEETTNHTVQNFYDMPTKPLPLSAAEQGMLVDSSSKANARRIKVAAKKPSLAEEPESNDAEDIGEESESDKESDKAEARLQLGHICPILFNLQLDPIMHKTDFEQFDACLTRFIDFQKTLSIKDMAKWLMNKRLICSQFRCPNHPQKRLEVGMQQSLHHGCVEIQYCWYAQCCPQRSIKLNCNSIFEISKLSPVNVLHVVYEWSRGCTLSQAVKNSMPNFEIDRLYWKLRAICTLQLMQQERDHKLGGSDRKVEVHLTALNDRGDASLLVVIDRQSCEVRMQLRSVRPSASHISRKQQLERVLRRWVHKPSLLCVDDTVNTDLIQRLGFVHVQQGTPLGQWGNRHAVCYANKVAKRLKALCALPTVSQSGTQLLLNEILWREQYANNSYVAFNNILEHLAAQTQLLGQVGLEQRLLNVARHPFKPLRSNRM